MIPIIGNIIEKNFLANTGEDSDVSPTSLLDDIEPVHPIESEESSLPVIPPPPSQIDFEEIQPNNCYQTKSLLILT